MTDMFTKAAWIIPLLPLAAFLLLTAAGRSFRSLGPIAGSAASLASFALALLVLLERLQDGAVDYNSSFDWISIGSYTLGIGFEVTNLTTLMLVIVSFVSFLINVYSAGYMKNDERINVYYGYVSLFVFAMLGLVLSDNLLALYIFWELVGVCSFLLIGFWYTKPAARAAAKKAFIVTRIGDAGLLLGIILLFWYMPDHALDFTMIESVFEGGTGAIAAGITTVIALLIFLGAAGKSGQFPLHVWLPDAMEGPTPISALIHAATMVAAGVFLIARTFDIFQASPAAMDTVAYIGGFTALFAATIALAQHDIKRILAYSTVSQLGYMMMALGIGSLTGGVFHLMTHAFFKALLFLGAGCVIHAAHTQDIRRMGGLGSRMKITAWTFAAGALALSGIPPLAGFWSKDAILAAALEANSLLFAAGLAAAFCTALYMTRLFVLVFLGEPRFELAAANKVREMPPTMTMPLLALVVLTVVSGFAETPWNGWLSGWLGEEAETHAGWAAMLASVAASLLGLYAGWSVYRKGALQGGAAVKERVPGLVALLERQYYIDKLYAAVAVKPVRAVGTALSAIDRYAVGGLVKLAGGAAGWAGRLLTRLQNGQAQGYALTAVIGLVILLLAMLGRRFLT